MTIDVEALKAALAEAPRNQGGKCAVQLLVTEHPEAEEVLRAAILDVRRSAARTSEILTRNGLKISETTVKRHRNGTCTKCKEASKS